MVKNNKRVVLKIFIFLIAIIFILISIWNYYSNKAIQNMELDITIGKDIYISIKDNMIVNDEFLKKVKDGQYKTDKPFFNMISKETLDELIKYLEENNLKIKQGDYIINQASSFKEIKDKLKFEQVD